MEAQYEDCKASHLLKLDHMDVCFYQPNLLRGKKMASKGFMQLSEILQNVSRRIEELQTLQAKIEDTPRGAMSSNFEKVGPELKDEYLEIATYMKTQSWFNF